MNKDEYPFTAIELRIEESINDMLRLRIELSWGDEVPVLDTKKEIKNNSSEIKQEVLDADWIVSLKRLRTNVKMHVLQERTSVICVWITAPPPLIWH